MKDIIKVQVKEINGKHISHLFNICYETAENEYLLGTCFKIIEGKMYSPSISFRKGTFHNAIFLDRALAEAVYDVLKEKLPHATLLEKEECIKTVLVTKKDLAIYCEEAL